MGFSTGYSLGSQLSYTTIDPPEGNGGFLNWGELGVSQCIIRNYIFLVLKPIVMWGSPIARKV
jgi:hypothetical protein